MKLVLDNGLEIPLEDIKLINVNDKQRIIINVEKGAANETSGALENIWDALAEFFKPAKIILVTGELRIEGIESIGAVH